MKVFHQSLQFSSSSPQFAYSWLCNDLSSPNFYIAGFLEIVPFVEKLQISTKLSQPKIFLSFLFLVGLYLMGNILPAILVFLVGYFPHLLYEGFSKFYTEIYNGVSCVGITQYEKFCKNWSPMYIHLFNDLIFLLQFFVNVFLSMWLLLYLVKLNITCLPMVGCVEWRVVCNSLLSMLESNSS